MVGRLTPEAASYISIPQKLGLAERQLWRKLIDRLGSRRDRPPFGFIAGKQSVKFQFLKAACRH